MAVAAGVHDRAAALYGEVYVRAAYACGIAEAVLADQEASLRFLDSRATRTRAAAKEAAATGPPHPGIARPGRASDAPPRAAAPLPPLALPDVFRQLPGAPGSTLAAYVAGCELPPAAAAAGEAFAARWLAGFASTPLSDDAPLPPAVAAAAAAAQLRWVRAAVEGVALAEAPEALCTAALTLGHALKCAGRGAGPRRRLTRSAGCTERQARCSSRRRRRGLLWQPGRPAYWRRCRRQPRL